MSQSTRHRKPPQQATIGKHVLDSISIGMYVHPLMAIREYIQNSADSIDTFHETHNGFRAKVDITVDGRSRSLTIKDNGIGIPSEKALSVLHDLGRSEKNSQYSRGFRGIGRLGGLGYCEKLRFKTKSKGEDLISISTWDCKKLRELIGDNDDRLEAASVIKQVAKLKQQKTTRVNDHYFIVEMEGIRNSRNGLLDVPAIKAYLSQVAPVPFGYRNFGFSQKIETRLKENVPLYKTYSIFVNGEKIYKPYSNILHSPKSKPERIQGIKFFNLVSDFGPLAYGWLGEIDLRGTIDPSLLVDGLRVRSGNILIGDKYLLSGFFREKRFSNYLIGEVHIINSALVLNSRRDDFEDGALKDSFYASFVREIGAPYSREIRRLSSVRSEEKNRLRSHELFKRAERIVESGHVAKTQVSFIEKELLAISQNGHDSPIRNKAEKLASQVATSEHVLSRRGSTDTHPMVIELEEIFEVIFRGASNKEDAERIIKEILEGPSA